MAKIVWRYRVYQGQNTINMPDGATVQTVESNNGNVYIVAIVDMGVTPVARFFLLQSQSLPAPANVRWYVGEVATSSSATPFVTYETTS